MRHAKHWKQSILETVGSVLKLYIADWRIIEKQEKRINRGTARVVYSV